MSRQDDSAEKSFDPTPQKLEEARKRGEIPRSTDLNVAAAYLGLIISFSLVAPISISRIGDFSVYIFSNASALSKEVFGISGKPFLGQALTEVSSGTAILFLVPAAMVATSLAIQRAWIFSKEKIAPKMSRISPISGIKNKFGISGLFEFLKSTLKLIIVSASLVWLLLQEIDTIISASHLSVGQISIIIGQLTVKFLALMFLFAFSIGIIDYLWQVFQHLKKNRMTRKEVEDETKSTEGDPHLKQARRQKAYDIATNQMLADIPKASVVIVNPTHFAVALSWQRDSHEAPKCVAKGTDHIAMRIREAAERSNVPIHSDPPTARAMFATVEVGQQILPDHYKPVAIAIRFAEKMRARKDL